MTTPQTRAKRRYNRKTYEQIHLYVAKGRKAVYRDAAEREGQSLNAYIVQAVEKRIAPRVGSVD